MGHDVETGGIFRHAVVVAGNQRHRRRVRPLGRKGEILHFRVGPSIRRQEVIGKANEARIEVEGGTLRSAPRAPQAVVGRKQGAVSSFAGVGIVDSHDGIAFAGQDPRVVGAVGEEDRRSVGVDGVDAGGFGDVVGGQGEQEEGGHGVGANLLVFYLWRFDGADGINRVGKGFHFRRVRRVVHSIQRGVYREVHGGIEGQKAVDPKSSGVVVSKDERGGSGVDDVQTGTDGDVRPSVEAMDALGGEIGVPNGIPGGEIVHLDAVRRVEFVIVGRGEDDVGEVAEGVVGAVGVVREVDGGDEGVAGCVGGDVGIVEGKEEGEVGSVVSRDVGVDDAIVGVVGWGWLGRGSG